MDYAICEISGKQYLVYPNQAFEVDLQSTDAKKIEASVLLVAQNGNIKIGKPYLVDKITLTCLEEVKQKKVRSAKFHAKANYRRVVGLRPRKTKVVYAVKK